MNTKPLRVTAGAYLLSVGRMGRRAGTSLLSFLPFPFPGARWGKGAGEPSSVTDWPQDKARSRETLGTWYGLPSVQAVGSAAAPGLGFAPPPTPRLEFTEALGGAHLLGLGWAIEIKWNKEVGGLRRPWAEETAGPHQSSGTR